MLHVYLTLGEYDLVATIEAPSDEVCVSISLALGSLGNLRSTTLKAFREKDLPHIVEGIPSLEDEFNRMLRGFRSA